MPNRPISCHNPPNRPSTLNDAQTTPSAALSASSTIWSLQNQPSSYQTACEEVSLVESAIRHKHRRDVMITGSITPLNPFDSLHLENGTQSSLHGNQMWRLETSVSNDSSAISPNVLADGSFHDTIVPVYEPLPSPEISKRKVSVPIRPAAPVEPEAEHTMDETHESEDDSETEVEEEPRPILNVVQEVPKNLSIQTSNQVERIIQTQAPPVAAVSDTDTSKDKGAEQVWRLDSDISIDEEDDVNDDESEYEEPVRKRAKRSRRQESPKTFRSPPKTLLPKLVPAPEETVQNLKDLTLLSGKRGGCSYDEGSDKSGHKCSNPNCDTFGKNTTWRYIMSIDPNRIKPYCNACKLYYDEYRRHRPRNLCLMPKKNQLLRNIPEEDRKCTNCGTRKPALWRFLNKVLMCNACAQYEKKNGKPRPYGDFLQLEPPQHRRSVTSETSTSSKRKKETD